MKVRIAFALIVLALYGLNRHPWLIDDWSSSASEFLSRPSRLEGAAIERNAYTDYQLVDVGYRYGMAVRRFYQRPAEQRDACQQMALVDVDVTTLHLPEANVEFLNAKLIGMAEMRTACRKF
jgi:hypothetical protein